MASVLVLVVWKLWDLSYKRRKCHGHVLNPLRHSGMGAFSASPALTVFLPCQQSEQSGLLQVLI